jgi:hypothetical protein
MLSINVPESAWSRQRITLGGVVYDFVFQYNTRDERWRLSIYQENSVVLEGVKIMSTEDLLSKYKLQNFKHGTLYCVKSKKVNGEATYNNFGIDKPFTLVYLTTAELEALGG